MKYYVGDRFARCDDSYCHWECEVVKVKDNNVTMSFKTAEERDFKEYTFPSFQFADIWGQEQYRVGRRVTVCLDDKLFEVD